MLVAGRQYRLLIGVIVLSMPAIALSRACHPLLWPTNSAVMTAVAPSPAETIIELQRWSNKVLNKPCFPVETLSSSGRIDLDDKRLLASRKGFQDADRAALLALSYRLTHHTAYFNKAKNILLRWAQINHPTGHPIDETRLEGMIWAYDLLSCELSMQEKSLILGWLARLYTAKVAWQFGHMTQNNNYRIHQLKMLLLLEKVLHRDKNWVQDIKQAEYYSTLNLDPTSGISIDYKQRSALYYHNYTLQPWLEICLITHCCNKPVKQAFVFLSQQILTHHMGNEFAHSQAKIDVLRARYGFVYAKKGGTFDVTKATPTIVSYYTLFNETPDGRLWSNLDHTKPSPWLVFLKARRALWRS